MIDEMIHDDLSPEQKRLLVWRDYFELLREGLLWNNGGRKDGWSSNKVNTVTWIETIITEIESDVMHIECGQEEHCQFGDVKDLAKLDGNIDARNERR